MRQTHKQTLQPSQKRFRRPTAYDVYYLAVADLLDCELWTADRRLVTAVHDAFTNAKLVGVDQFTPE